LQLNTVSHGDNNDPTTIQTIAALAIGTAFPSTNKRVENPYENQSIWMEVTSYSDVFSAGDAYQVINAGLSNPSTTQNAFLSSAQMDDMQRAYTRGTKVFILRDSARCYIVPVTQLSAQEQSLVAQSFANCVSK
jgi:hypothetical protein